MKTIDLRSDTVSKPTEEMRIAMQNAEVGDDVFEEDPTVSRLEQMAANIVGKEAALFVPTGTMGNQISVMSHTNPGDEMIAGMYSHVVHNECGGVARLSGVGCAQIDNPDEKIYPKDIKKRVRPLKINFPRTSLVCLENALGNGDVVDINLMNETYKTAKDFGLSVHLDGARLFNAALALGTTAKEIASCTDSVMFCVSKGLCAPVGSLVCGTKEFISEARRCRKLLGGGMRQVGILAAAGIVAIEKMTNRLHIDHENAVYLGELLSQIDGINVEKQNIKINMVYWKPEVEGFDNKKFIFNMKEKGIIVSGQSDGYYRFVTHNDIEKEDIAIVAENIKSFVLSL